MKPDQQTAGAGAPTGAGPAGTGGGAVMPLTGRISSEYGADRPGYTGRSGAVESHVHAGVDIAAPQGSKVGSTKDGVVVGAGWHKGYGNTVDILHADGRFERHAHLANMNVKKGDKVAAGQQVGDIGPEGHDHFEVHSRYSENPADNYGRNTTIDPAEYLGAKKGSNLTAGQAIGAPPPGSDVANTPQPQQQAATANTRSPLPPLPGAPGERRLPPGTLYNSRGQPYSPELTTMSAQEKS
jgi:murein DD-endopeptidase MepM/ murein hydrolase activator NlpD